MKQIAFLSIVFSLLCIVSFTQNVDIKKSSVKWIGKKITGKHFGFLNIKSGNVNMDGNSIKNSIIIVDMTSLTCTDIEDKEMNKKLVGHLMSSDFFNTAIYKEAKLEIKSPVMFKGKFAQAKAYLTIKEKKLPVEFKIFKRAENFFEANLQIDRTLYDIRYGSGKFFKNLGNKAIKDIFDLKVKIILN